LQHGPVMFDQPLQPKSVADERRHCLANGMVPFVTPTMLDGDIAVGIATVRVVYERFRIFEIRVLNGYAVVGERPRERMTIMQIQPTA